MEGCVNVYVEGFVPGGGSYIEQAALRSAACTMHEHVQPSKRSDRLLNATGCFSGIRYISRYGQCSTIQSLHIPFNALRERVICRQAAHRDVRSSSGELAGRSRTYAATPSRN
jgi:hypothetical protein